MTNSFTIKKICNAPGRPPYSHKVERYFESFVQEHVIAPLQLQTGNVLLSIMILTREETGTDGIAIYEPTTIEEMQLTFYPIAILLEDVYAGENAMENIASLYFQAISLFFRNYFPAVTADHLLQAKEKIDWQQLQSIPYPAALDEQQYIGDGSSN